MNIININKFNKNKTDWILIGGVIIALIGYILLHNLCEGALTKYNPWDSYSIQAMAWRNGSIMLEENYSHLEIAIYNGNYFLSFPPFPSVVMLPFTFIFGEQPPSNLIIMLFTIISFVFIYLIIKNMTISSWSALVWAFFIVFGSNILWMSTIGGVWFLAQILNFMLCSIAIYCYQKDNRMLCLTFIAMAVGCRPFSICLLFAIFTLFIIKDIKEKRKPSNIKAVIYNFKYLIIPIVIGISYLIYNYVRFENPFEFGHNYLPEFSEQGSEQFGIKYLLNNLQNIFTVPININKELILEYPIYNGFMFFIANPIFIVWFVYIIKDVIKKEFNIQKGVICIALVSNLIFLCLHKTFGGWQFGARYTVDLIPYVVIYFMLKKVKTPQKFEVFLGMFAVLFNMYGALAIRP